MNKRAYDTAALAGIDFVGREEIVCEIWKKVEALLKVKKVARDGRVLGILGGPGFGEGFPPCFLSFLFFFSFFLTSLCLVIFPDRQDTFHP